MPQELLSNIINLAILVLIALIGLAIRQIYSGLPPDKQAIVNEAARRIVPAIQQSMETLSNPEKKTIAMNWLREELAYLNIKDVPESMLSSAIEQVVFATKQELADQKSTPLVGFTQPTTSSATTAPGAKLVNRK